jgi:hypothetical protein
MSLLGLNKDYQDERWTPADTEASRRRLDHFIEAWLAQHPDDNRADVVRCLAFLASAVEVDACRSRNGFDPARCRLR